MTEDDKKLRDDLISQIRALQRKIAEIDAKEYEDLFPCQPPGSALLAATGYLKKSLGHDPQCSIRFSTRGDTCDCHDT